MAKYEVDVCGTQTRSADECVVDLVFAAESAGLNAHVTDGSTNGYPGVLLEGDPEVVYDVLVVYWDPDLDPSEFEAYQVS